MRHWAVAFLLAIVAAGCGQGQNVTAQVDSPDETIEAPPAPPPPATAPTVVLPRMIDLSVYQIEVPYGAVSESRDFWKPINQSLVNADTANLLNQNGVRVGSGLVEDWPKFKTILDVAGAGTLPSHYMAHNARDQEIAVTGELPDQTLFYFDRHGLSGRVYDQCQNLLALSFGPSPAVDGAVRLELCPVVRSTRRHYHYTVLNGQTVTDYVADERIYDLNLRVDLKQDQFIVIAPSPQSRRSVSIGHQFLTHDATAGRRETVFIFVANQNPRVAPAN